MAEVGSESDNHESGLAPPAVSAGQYDADYYLNWCAGYEEWKASDGAEYAPIYPGSLQRIRFRPGEVLVDIGTGRGEMLAAAAELGARKAVGIEYSPTAVGLAERTIEQRKVGDHTEVMLADARRLPLEEDFADVVTMLDVVEHLAPDELDRALREAYRILRPGGRLLIHTLPSRTVYEITYRLQRLARPSRWRRWPKDPRVDHERTMHVNEQTVPSLRRALKRAGFSNPKVACGEWIHTTFLPEERAKRLYRRLAAHRLTERLGVADIWAEAHKRLA